MRRVLRVVLSYVILWIPLHALASESAKPGFSVVGPDGCRFYVRTDMLNRFPNEARSWDGLCNSGFANGEGTLRVHDVSGRPASIGRGYMELGYFKLEDGAFRPYRDERISRIQRGGASTEIGSLDQLPVWARDFFSTGGAVSRVAGSMTQVPAAPAAQPTGGAYGAPDLLGFKIGMGPISSLEGKMNELGRNGYSRSTQRTERSPEAKEIISLAKAIRKPTNRTYHTVESSYVRLSVDADSKVRAVVRGETFVNMPFMVDFVPVLKEKLAPPSWVLETLQAYGRTPQSQDEARIINGETAWGVAAGRSVRLKECFSPFDHDPLYRNEYRPGDFQTHYYSIVDELYKKTRPNVCQYVIAVLVVPPVYGEDRSLVVASYAVSVIDLQRIGMEAIGLDKAANDTAAAELAKRRNSAGKPKL